MKWFILWLGKKDGRSLEWSSDYSFLIPLSGTVKLFLKKKILELKKGDIVMIEPFQYFSLSDVSRELFALRVDLTKLMSAPGRLECNSVMELHKERYHEVICDILHLVQEIQQENVCAYVREMKWSYQLLEHLLRDFRVETEISDTEFPMMQNVLFYISQHYKEALTLATLAEQFFVSSSYISKMFREKLDTSFLKYINEIRLLHAAGQLRDARKTIDQIAEESGLKMPDLSAPNFGSIIRFCLANTADSRRRKHLHGCRQMRSRNWQRFCSNWKRILPGQN